MFQKIKNLYYSRSSNFWLLETHSSLFNIANSITSIFIPILMLKIGFEIKDVLLYYIIFHFFDVILNFFSKKVLEKFSPKIPFFIGVFFVMIYYFIYSKLNTPDWNILFLMALVAAFFDSFYYVVFYRSIFNSTKKIENVKTNNIIVNILSTFSSSIGPLIGSFLILVFEDKNILLYTSLGVFILSLIPLLFYTPKNIIEDNKISFKEFFKKKNNWKNFLTLAFYKISETSEYVIFPIFIYLIYQGLDSIAYLTILGTFSVLIATWFSGKIKVENREKTIIFSAFFLVLIWLARMYFNNTILLYSSILFSSIFLTFIFIPMDTNIFREAKNENPTMMAFYKNTISMFSKLLFYLILYFVLDFLKISTSFWLIIVSLVFVILTNLFYLKIKK